MVVKEAKGCARFRIFFEKPDTNEFYRIDHGSNMRQLFLRSSVAEWFNFSPNERIGMLIRSCVHHDSKEHDTCGTFSLFELQSNVGGIWSSVPFGCFEIDASSSYTPIHCVWSPRRSENIDGEI